MAARSQEDEKEGRSRIRVCYLGPEATFCHEAALKQFGGGPGYLPAASISGVFEAVENDRADKGVVPVENAIEGTVNVTLDHLIDSPLEIVGEVLLPIDIHLLTHAESVSDIQRVLSHPHAVAQCRTWLQENLPDVHVEEVASTALAAKGSGGGRPLRRARESVGGGALWPSRSRFEARHREYQYYALFRPRKGKASAAAEMPNEYFVRSAQQAGGAVQRFLPPSPNGASTSRRLSLAPHGARHGSIFFSWTWKDTSMILCWQKDSPPSGRGCNICAS